MLLCTRTTLVHDDTHAYEHFLKTSAGLGFSLVLCVCLGFSILCFFLVQLRLLCSCVVTFRVSRRHSSVCVCLSAAACPHYCMDPDVTSGKWYMVPPSCALLGGFAISAHVALLCQHSANARCQRVFVLAVCLVCFCCVRFSFFSTTPRDWLGRTSQKRSIPCQVGRKIPNSINQPRDPLLYPSQQNP